MSTTSYQRSSHKSHETVINRLTEVGEKDLRAHERARHQTRERRGHAQVKERKEKAAAARAVGLKQGHASRTGRRVSMESWEGDEPDYPLAASGCPATVLPVPRNTSGFSKIALADLVTFKVKKPPKNRDADFEVIPPVRSVIALSDDFALDIEIDEPWEVVSISPESPTWKGLSYAQAATLTL